MSAIDLTGDDDGCAAVAVALDAGLQEVVNARRLKRELDAKAEADRLKEVFHARMAAHQREIEQRRQCNAAALEAKGKRMRAAVDAYNSARENGVTALAAAQCPFGCTGKWCNESKCPCAEADDWCEACERSCEVYFDKWRRGFPHPDDCDCQHKGCTRCMCRCGRSRYECDGCYASGVEYIVACGE